MPIRLLGELRENLTSVALGLRYFVHTASPGAVIEVVKVVRTRHVLQRAGILTPGPTVRFAGSRCGGRSADDKPVAWGDIREARENYEDEAEAPFDPAILIPGSRSGVRRRSRVPDPPDCAARRTRSPGSAPDEYFYAEGLARNCGEWSSHAWVVRKSTGEVIECTSGYQTTTCYRGICLEIGEVEACVDGRALVNGKTCRERWRTFHPDGSLRSEAPGVITILAEEIVNKRIDFVDWNEEQKSWLGRNRRL